MLTGKMCIGAMPRYAAYKACIADGGIECYDPRGCRVSRKCGVGVCVGLMGSDAIDAGYWLWRGYRAPIPSKGKQALGPLSCRRQSIEMQTAVLHKNFEEPTLCT